jgi:hypothetical protein
MVGHPLGAFLREHAAFRRLLRRAAADPCVIAVM